MENRRAEKEQRGQTNDRRVLLKEETEEQTLREEKQSACINVKKTDSPEINAGNREETQESGG